VTSRTSQMVTLQCPMCGAAFPRPEPAPPSYAYPVSSMVVPLSMCTSLVYNPTTFQTMQLPQRRKTVRP
jgi:hypothetical protein